MIRHIINAQKQGTGAGALGILCKDDNYLDPEVVGLAGSPNWPKVFIQEVDYTDPSSINTGVKSLV